MIVSFGQGKCPLCGNFGKNSGRRTFRCSRCDISFNDFAISSTTDIGEYTDMYWN
jgi:tRNA(Ile2) C34 agmatinyltransferase TiaS